LVNKLEGMQNFRALSLAIIAFFIGVSPAMAHSELVTTSPLANSTVEAGPIRIKLDFDEAPLKLPFGQGNLIAVAVKETGEQLGPACAKVEGNSLTTIVKLSAPGEYKILWRIASEDGHVNSGDFDFTVVNNSNYSTDKTGNQCFDEQGVELDAADQEPLSVKVQQNDGLLQGFIFGLGFIIVGTLAGAFLVRSKPKR